MNWEPIKKTLTIASNVRIALVVVGIFTAFTFPKTFQDRPTTLVIATVSRTVIMSSVPDHPLMVKMNLSIIIKCLTSQDRQCSHQLWKIQWPGLGTSMVRMPTHLQEGVRGPFIISNGDLQGRSLHGLELLKSLQGTDTIVINVEINGRVVREDIKLLDIKGVDVLRDTDRYECHSSESASDLQLISQVVCEEQIGIKQRMLALIPLMGN